ncbi:predicted protein [Burkholderiales bacterium GJ-E10]|nr:predicted protein [Burkholderiales bacterium GJ-E10]
MLRNQPVVNPGIAIARLAGVIETPGERAADSLVFVLETEDGRTIRVSYGLLMESLRFAQAQGIMPPLSEHWWARIADTDDGFALQEAGR